MYILQQIKKQQSKGGLDKYISSRNHNAFLAKKKKIITIKGNVIVYGSLATNKLASKIAYNIAGHWNFPKAKVEMEGSRYLVQFVLKGISYKSLPANIVQQNKDQKNIFIRLENEVATQVSLMDGVCSNTGFFKLANVAYKGSSTEAHEYGHALGLWPGTADGHPPNLDFRGKGRPGIMYPRGTLVDAKYQYLPNVEAGQPGGTVLPDYRRVTQEDIDNLFLPKKNWRRKGTARIGKITNCYHNVEYELK